MGCSLWFTPERGWRVDGSEGSKRGTASSCLERSLMALRFDPSLPPTQGKPSNEFRSAGWRDVVVVKAARIVRLLKPETRKRKPELQGLGIRGQVRCDRAETSTRARAGSRNQKPSTYDSARVLAFWFLVSLRVRVQRCLLICRNRGLGRRCDGLRCRRQRRRHR